MFSERTMIALRLSLMYGAFSLVIGFHMPYWPVWLRDAGLDAGEIGILLSAGLVIRIVTGPLTALAADWWTNRGGERRLPLILLAWASLIFFTLFIWGEGFGVFLVITLLVMAVFPSQVPLMENLALRAAEDKDIPYGRVRIWGSITFILGNFGGGWLLAQYGSPAILWAVLAAMVLGIVAAHLLPRNDRPMAIDPMAADMPSQSADPAPAAAALDWRGAARLAANPVFLLFVASASLVQASHAVYYGFGTLNWQRLGYDETLIGSLWATGVIAEIVLFIYAARVVRRVNPAILLAIGGAAALLRWTVIAMNPPLYILFPINALHAATYGAAHLGAMYFILRAVPVRLAATGQSLYAAFAAGIVIALVMAAAGALYTRFEGGAYLFMAIPGGLGLICALILMRVWRGGVLELAPSVRLEEPGTAQKEEAAQ